MDRERGSKVIAIVALCVGVVGLSLGFAAFSSNLTIKSSASVTVEDNFSVYFDEDSIEAIPTGGATADAEAITVTNTEKKEEGSQVYATSEIGDLHANFTAPGQSVTFKFNAVNNGQYVAYLTDAEFGVVAGTELFKKCTAATGTTQSLVDAACENISLTLKVGDEVITSGTTTFANEIAINGTTPVEVTITYAEKEGVDNQPLADGDFEVAFGDIGLTYKSVR